MHVSLSIKKMEKCHSKLFFRQFGKNWLKREEEKDNKNVGSSYFSK